MERYLQHLNSLDELTGLSNRRGLREHFVRERALVDRSAELAGLIVVEVNGDGGLDGEDALEVVLYAATVLRAELRASDTLARLEDGRFAAILPGAGMAQSAGVAAKVVTSIASRELDLGGRLHRPKARAGVTTIRPRTKVTLDETLADAERGLPAQRAPVPQRKE